MENKLVEKLVDNLIKENEELKQEIKSLQAEIQMLRAMKESYVPDNPIINPQITWDKLWWKDGPTCTWGIELLNNYIPTCEIINAVM